MIDYSVGDLFYHSVRVADNYDNPYNLTYSNVEFSIYDPTTLEVYLLEHNEQSLSDGVIEVESDNLLDALLVGEYLITVKVDGIILDETRFKLGY